MLEAETYVGAWRRHRWTVGLSRAELFSSSEIDELRTFLKPIESRIEPILQLSFRLYLAKFTHQRALSAISFFDVYRPGVIAATGHLLAGEIDDFVLDTVTLGQALADRRVPFEEIVECCHLMTRAGIEAVGAIQITHDIYMLLDKLSHLRIMLLTEAYFRSCVAPAVTRIGALEREARQIPLESRSTFHGLVGSSPSMRQLYSQIETVARHDAPILLVGEDGTEKTAVARAIHELRCGAAAPLDTLNCASLPPDLIEAELFGYHHGAFTGAIADYAGRTRIADGGTLLLDDINELAASTQVKLLHLLDDKVVKPLGAVREFAVNLCVVAATSCDPEKAVEAGKLDRDLLNKFASSTLALPPLRDRRDDIPLLTEHFISLLNVALELPEPVAGIDGEALSAMQRYDWT
ncbi:MAG: sigma 54-interacting transcriptional regulator, partial [Candidatus Binataceae bacterium]